MGIDEGFDMVPRLSKGREDSRKWEAFITAIKNFYADDNKVEITPNYIEFKAGEHPLLPLQGHKFLRFSSKVSGSIAHSTGVSSYIGTVTKAARMIFGPRVHHWSEAIDQQGFYGWREVHESQRSYDVRDEPEICTGTVVSSLDYWPIFELVSILGRGQGLVARCNIPKGTRIISEKPLFTVRSMPLPELEKAIATKLKALTREEQGQFLSLHNNFPGRHHPFSGIVKTNALPCGSGSPTGGVYPTICRINHSCLPNAHNNWNGELGLETIHAIRDIRAGEEITIDYSDGGPSYQRQSKLREAFGFSCDCAACSLAPSEKLASDVRRGRIQALDDAVGDPYRMMNDPAASLADCYETVRTLEEEYPNTTTASTARVYYDAFQISIAHGDRARAKVFAERAYRARVIIEGEDSPATKDMRGFALDPSRHKTFGVYSAKWKGSKKFDPNTLNEVELEKWLWRQSK